MKISFKSLPAFLTLVLILVYSSCRKNDQRIELIRDSVSGVEEKFFNSNRSSDKKEKVVVDFLKRHNKIKNFVDQTVNQVGFPHWNKSVLIPWHKRGIHKSEIVTDTIIIIPFVRESEHFVNASLSLEFTGSDTTASWICDWQYSLRPKSNGAVSDNSAEKFALFMIMMDANVFDHKDYVLSDSLLFQGVSRFSNNFQPGISGSRTLHLDQDSSSSGSRGTTLSGPEPIYNWSMWYYYILDVYGIGNFPEFFPDPNYSGTGGGGGGDVPPPPNCQIQASKGQVYQGCTPGWFPPDGVALYIPFFGADTMVNNFVNPCIVAAKNKLPDINLNIFARSLYFAPISHTYNWKIIFEENRNLVDNSNNPMPAESFAVTPRKEWHVVLNPLFWEQSTQPNATQEIAGLNILHEIVHGFIRVYKDHYNLSVLNTFTTHEVMFKNFIDAMSKVLQSSFGISVSDAKALALQGLDDVLQKEYTAAGTVSSYNAAYNQFSISNYGVSIPGADSVFTDYLNGTKGIRCF